MEYEDTNMLRTQYVDELVNQRQNMENAMLYQNAEVSSGEGFSTMVPKVEALTGSQPSLPYISFNNCTLTALPNMNFNTMDKEVLHNVFRNLTEIYTLDLRNLVLKGVKDFSYMFSTLANHRNEHLYPDRGIFYINSLFDLTDAETLEGMFSTSGRDYVLTRVYLDYPLRFICKNLKNVSKFAYRNKFTDVSARNLLKCIYGAPVEDISYLFSCLGYSSSDNDFAAIRDTLRHVYKHWDLKNLTNMDYTFSEGGYYRTLDTIIEFLRNINYSNVKSMRYMLYENTSQYQNSISKYVLDLSMHSFDSIENCYQAFSIDGFTEINLGAALNGTVQELTFMFRPYNNSKSLRTINMGLWDLSSAVAVYYMFDKQTALENLYFGLNLGKAYTKTSANYSSYSVYLKNSPLLTVESVLFMFNRIYDLNLTYNVVGGGKLYTQKIELHSDVLAKLTPEEIAIATNKGWTVV